MSWVPTGGDGGFGIDNLPYGSGIVDGSPRVLVRVGDGALDLTSAMAATEYAALFARGTLDVFLGSGRATWIAVRALVRSWLSDPAQRPRIEALLVPLDSVRLQLPFTVADYVDFYASENHATNVGRIFRPGAPPLTPNWKHLPIGYHGRAGTVVVSGTSVRRPSGQFVDAHAITFGPSRRLDIEAEVAFVVGAGSSPGAPVTVQDFPEHVFGVALLNDWSARDIQAFESVPLGPFLGKSFATSLSAWVTPLDALAAAWVVPPPRDQQPLPYLDDSVTPSGLDLDIRVELNGQSISHPPFASMYWTGPQLLAHLTVNGAHLRTGDLFASGTVSGSSRAERGSLLELSWGGTEPMRLPDGSTRTFLEEGDEVVITATAPGPRGRIGLGEVRGQVVG